MEGEKSYQSERWKRPCLWLLVLMVHASWAFYPSGPHKVNVFHGLRMQAIKLSRGCERYPWKSLNSGTPPYTLFFLKAMKDRMKNFLIEKHRMKERGLWNHAALPCF